MVPTFSIPSALEKKQCVAFCTSGTYNLKSLYEALKASYRVIFYRNVVQIELSPHAVSPYDVQDIFCFSYGTVVMWGLNEEKQQSFLNELKKFEVLPQETHEKEIMTFFFGSQARIVEDEIELPDDHIFHRLAASHALAQSVRLSAFEDIIQKTIDKTKSIPEQLATRGKIPLSKHEIRKKMGELFIERSSVNLYFDLLDEPEFFWDHPEFQPLYTIIVKHLELKTRLEVLNQRLDIVHDLFQMLGNELNHQHSSKLEWTIIWLIVIEVVLTLLRDFFAII